MENTTKPALVPCLGLLLGTVAGHGLGSVQPVAAAALLAAALALGRFPVRFLIPFALSLWQVVLQPPGADEIAALFDSRLPVTVVGRVQSHPQLDGGEARSLVRVEGLGQRGGMRAVRFDLWLVSGEPLHRGARMRGRGYLRRSSGAWNTPGSGEGRWRLRIKSSVLLTQLAEPGPLDRITSSWRRVLEQRLEAVAGEEAEEARGLARALVLGDRSELPLAWQQVLRRHGLGHLLAVSGLHLGMVAMAVLVLASPLPPTPRYSLVLVALVVYTGVLGPRPSVLRAGCMGALGFLALGLQRPPRALNALCCGVGGLVWLDPEAVFDLGLQLSASATAGILILGPRLEERWQKLPRFLCRPLAATVGAQVSVLPWIWPLEAGFHPAAPLGNLLGVPWLFGALVCSWALFLCPSPGFGLSDLFLFLLESHVRCLEALVELPPSRLFFWPWYLSSISATAVAGCLLLFLWSRSSARWVWALGACVLLGLGRPGPMGVELRMLDVGQGDAMVLRDRGRAVLVDGGGWPAGDLGGRILVPALAGAGIDRLQAMVMTHADRDHCGGLVDVARYVETAELWMSPGWQDSECGARLLSVRGPRLRPARLGERLRAGRWELEVLSPGDEDPKSGNDDSLVLRASVFGQRVILTGDLEAAGERRLLERLGTDLDADVLKVAHHGSRTSTSDRWLRVVAPRWGLISAGRRNPYGHPATDVLERLESHGVRVLRTDRSGQIVLRFGTGGEIAVSRPASRPPEKPLDRADRR